jgi:uncharacterized SAM-binding protein YcdF (DUF218 family)
MPGSPLHRRRRFRLVLGTAALVLTAAGIAGFLLVGRFLAREDTLQKADAIFVFAGRRIERPLEAADLFLEGYAPLIVLTRDTSDAPIPMLERRGVHLPTTLELTLDMLRQAGVPIRAVITPARMHDHTSEEAETLRTLAMERQWHRVILVTSKYHLRRATLAARRALKGTDVEVLTRATRHDASTPERWWARRDDIRTVTSEVPKLVAYWLGVGL